jgi:hypothetical protein
MTQHFSRLSALRTVQGLIALWAGATAASAQQPAPDFCGRTTGEPAALLAAVTADGGLKEIYRGAEYVAYQDGASQAVFTFSLEGVGRAHPAAVCRKPIKDGDSLKLQMVVICKGEVDSCQALESDFKLLNAKMEAAIRNEAGQAAPPVK